MKNIEIFKTISAVVLAELYGSFPLPINIDPSIIVHNIDDDLWDEATIQDPDYPNLHHYQRKYSPTALASPTIEWLAAAGLISFSEKKDRTFENVVLTPKGLESIEAEAGRGDNLITAAKLLITDASKDAAKDNLKSVFSDVLKWCVEKSPTLVQVIKGMVG